MHIAYFGHFEFIVHIGMSALPGTHLSEVKHMRLKCLAENTVSTMSER